MKTIKFTLFGLLSLLIAVLLFKYAIMSLNYITIDFITPEDKGIHNFGLTFAIQSIVLTTLAFIALATMLGSFQLAIKYYHISAKERRNKQLLNHLDNERYNELISKLRSTNSIDKKKDYIDEYLNSDNKKTLFKNSLSNFINLIKDKRMEEQKRKQEAATNTMVAERDTFNIDKTVYKD